MKYMYFVFREVRTAERFSFEAKLVRTFAKLRTRKILTLEGLNE